MSAGRRAAEEQPCTCGHMKAEHLSPRWRMCRYGGCPCAGFTPATSTPEEAR